MEKPSSPSLHIKKLPCGVTDMGSQDHQMPGTLQDMGTIILINHQLYSII